MPLTALTPVVVPNPYPGAGKLYTPAAADAVNGNSYVFTGSEILLAENSDGAGAHTVTITSAPDPFGRTTDIAAFSIPASGRAAFSKLQSNGWVQSDGTIHISVSSALILLSVLRFA